MTEGNKVNPDEGETHEPEVVNQPQVENKYEACTDPIVDSTIRDYQLARDMERRKPKPNPRYETLNLTEFALVLGQALEHLEPFF